ncbi:MAG: cache domain-containing protein [Treponema sp.]|jgi:PAS domain-containing protein|nr:cache domain-containing protein [Treponema sp.]
MGLINYTPEGTKRKQFHIDIRSTITGIAAVFTLLSIIALFIINISNMEAMNLEIAVFMGEEKLKGDMMHFESMLKNEYGVLRLQDGSLVNEQGISLVYRDDLINHLSQDLGIEAAIFIRENNDYRRIVTSTVDSSGERAENIFLGPESAAYMSVQSGMDYAGKDVILGNDYLTAYRPVFQPDAGEVIGILFVGVKMAAIQNIITQESDMRSIKAVTIRTGLIMLGTLLAVTLITILLRISAEKNLAEERVRIIFDAMPLGANIHKRNFGFIDCNENVLNLFGLSGKQEYFDKFWQLSPEYQPDGRLSSEKRDEYIDKAFSEGYCRFEWMHQKLNGEPISCEITLVRVMYNNEFVLAAYVRDLRELKQMMEEIKQRENLLNTVNSATNILLSINDEKSFEYSLLKSFELVGRFLNVDRVQIWRNEVIDGELHFIHRYEWLSEYGRSCLPVPIGLHFPYSAKPEWETLFLRGGYINAPLSGLPEDDRAFLSPYGMKSIVIIPIFLERQITVDRRQATVDRRHVAVDRRQMAGDGQQATDNRRQANLTGGRR